MNNFWKGFEKRANESTNNAFESHNEGEAGGDQQLEAIFGFEERAPQPDPFPGKPMDGAEGPIRGEGRYVD